jgi:hypothetical protein
MTVLIGLERAMWYAKNKRSLETNPLETLKLEA